MGVVRTNKTVNYSLNTTIARLFVFVIKVRQTVCPCYKGSSKWPDLDAIPPDLGESDINNSFSAPSTSILSRQNKNLMGVVQTNKIVNYSLNTTLSQRMSIGFHLADSAHYIHPTD